MADVLVAGPPPAPPRFGPAWRKRVLVIAAGGVALLLAGVAAFPGLLGTWSARTGGAVPSTVHRPWDWQALLASHPNGPASILVTGDGWGSELIGQAVVGTDGSYRMLDGQLGFLAAGSGTLLSPDGRYLAGSATYDPYSVGDLVILDLATGTRRVVTGVPGNVRTWRPDGGAVVVSASSPGNPLTDAYLVDLATGRATGVFVPAKTGGSEFTESLHRPDVAFSPDGRLIATGAGSWVAVSDAQRRVLWQRDLGTGLALAGRGAVTPDGRRVAIISSTICDAPCANQHYVSYVDLFTGLPTDGPDLPGFHASAVTAVGWNGDELLVTTYEPVGDAWVPDVWGLAPGGDPHLVVNLPRDAVGVDLPANLIRAGRLGGTPPVPGLAPINPRLGVPIAGVLVALLLAAVLFHRRRRRQSGSR